MSLIEQAIFTSAETDRSAGYQVVAASPGVCEADLRELAVWGPSHDALVEPGLEAQSVNFHPLPSGAWCVSRTVPAGWEYSGRGGERIYTLCLVVSPGMLERFANNPFAVLRAAQAKGALVVHDKVPDELKPLQLVGRASPVDQALLTRLANNPGPRWMATVMQAALGSVTLAIAGGPPAESLIAGLISAVPPECRTEFTFSTGLKFSSRRPFRIVGLSDDRTTLRRLARQYNATALDLSCDPPADFAPQEGWARFIDSLLRCGRTSFLATQFARRRDGLGLADLPALGLQFLEELEARSLDGFVPGAGALDEPDAAEKKRPTSLASMHGLSIFPEPDEEEGLDEADVHTQAHAAHRRFAKALSGAAVAPPSVIPSKNLHPESPDVLDCLERLDDLVFEAIVGQSVAFNELKVFWPQIRELLGDELLEESREQYLRYALTIWEECVEPGGVRQPARAMQALDVLCLLFGDRD